jgi:hypothetical protein
VLVEARCGRFHSPANTPYRYFDLRPAIRCTRTGPTAAVARLFNYRILARLGPLRVISGLP